MVSGGVEVKVVFLSNYFNHHQKPFCEAMYRCLGEDFTFISTATMREERRKLGYSDGDEPDYVLLSYANKGNKEKAITLINAADVVITGSAPEELLEHRKKNKKVIFRYAERPLKKAYQFWKYPYRWYQWHKSNPMDAFIYMLCASAYTAGDYAKFGLFKGKTYKWGYFPECKQYVEIDDFLKKKKRQEILWCGRFLDWKHPDDVLFVAKRLKEEGYDFQVKMIGTGKMESALKEYCEENDLSNSVLFLGSMTPDKVREHMEHAGIYLVTSDRQEGWGAVLNESMNSGCAVVSSHMVGAVPYLVRSRENGLIYEFGNVDDLYEKVKYLLDFPEEQDRLGKTAYQTIVSEWSAEIAAERLIRLLEHVLSEQNTLDLYENGPCSKAEILKKNWFKE